MIPSCYYYDYDYDYFPIALPSNQVLKLGSYKTTPDKSVS